MHWQSLTQVGEQPFRTVETIFAKIDNELQLIEHYRNSPSGLVRINCGLQVIETLLLPKLAHLRTDILIFSLSLLVIIVLLILLQKDLMQVFVLVVMLPKIWSLFALVNL